jgi:hypothetical protein
VLAPEGRLYLIYQPLVPERAGSTAETLSRVMESHGFAIEDVVIEQLSAATGVCVVAARR